MPATVEVRFKGIRRGYYRWVDEAGPLRLREPVIVEAERGFDFGHVSAVGEVADRKCGGCTSCAVGPGEGGRETASEGENGKQGENEAATVATLPRGDGENGEKGTEPAARTAVVRRATPEDVRQATDLRRGEDDVRRRVAERARSHGLVMKVSDAEWQWDRKKLTVYFTAEHRVDFRALVRELAAQYHTRIELRQIGVRDEAARLGGVGRCGREYCCSTWLTELSPVSLSLAKDQHLSLNPAQISGGCGRLLCCLKYEHEFYVTQRKLFPKEGKTVRTAQGPEKVVAVDIFRERVFLRSEEHGPRTVLLADLRAELEGPAEPAAADAAATPVTSAPALEATGTTLPPSADTPRRRRKRRRRRARGSPESGRQDDGD